MVKSGESLILSVCIVNWNTNFRLQKCLEMVYSNIGIEDFEVFIVDNNSSDDSLTRIPKNLRNLRIICNSDNRGFSKANNQMLRLAKGKYALLLNPDAYILPDAIPSLITFMERHPNVGACGPKLLNLDLSFQRSFFEFPTLYNEVKSHLVYNFPPFSRYLRGLDTSQTIISMQKTISEPVGVDAIPGACFLVRRKTYEEVGLMEEDYFLYSEENDWCWRMMKDEWQVFYFPESQVIHEGGESSKNSTKSVLTHSFYSSRYKFFKKHKRKYEYMILKMMNIFFFSWLLIITTTMMILNKYDRKLITENINSHLRLLMF
ncbi:putative Glycosyl transferase family 2 [uncultured Desulfobacterium sp.]|uniref:Putative Glycosyl transferase family 2 n=1 Tax=uncultured Desulfobacterium sp. TaxID=201089 RepID=A0A445MZZ3_9BACT|nr:putative Glycosyl transferase family 2 [uncultured Desulfobacterium sp.]